MWILGLKGLILFDNTPCALTALSVLSGRYVVDKGILYGHAGCAMPLNVIATKNGFEANCTRISRLLSV